MKIAGFRFRPGENGRRAALQIICFMLWAILLFGISPSAYNVFAHESAGGGTLSDGKEEAQQYGEYRQRLEEIEYKNDIAGRGFQVIEDQIFPIDLGRFHLSRPWMKPMAALFCSLRRRMGKSCIGRSSWKLTPVTGGGQYSLTRGFLRFLFKT